MLSLLERKFASTKRTGASGAARPVAMATEIRPEVDAVLQDEYEASLAAKPQRDAQLKGGVLGLWAALVASWLVGALGLSAAWLLVLLGAVGALWRASLSQLLEAVANFEALRVRRRRAWERDETAEWLNVLLNRWWVFSSESLYLLVKEQVEPLLNESKPSIVESVELCQFTLGGNSPEVKSVRVFDVAPCGRRLPPPLRPRTALGPSPRCQVALEADVGVDSDDFSMVLRTRLFGKGMGVDLDLAVEKLNVRGKVYATLTFSMDAPFPHFTHLNVTFVEKPEVWFSVRVLKSVQMMDVPILKTWLHSLVMEALASALVDPSSLDINLSSAGAPRPPTRDSGEISEAQGVLTVTITIPPVQAGQFDESPRWLVFALGAQRHRSTPFSKSVSCKESMSFLVGSLQHDQLLVKLKAKKLVSSVTLNQFELPLCGFGLDTNPVVETALHKKAVKGGLPSIPLHLQYTPLPVLQLDQLEPAWPTGTVGTVSGVLFVFIHSAEGLGSCDSAECNPYCMLFNNRKKTKTTHYLRKTTNPQWESKAQFLVSDYTRTVLSFVICSWSPKKMADTDLLGLANLSLAQKETWVIKRKLPLTGSASSGSVIVSVVFRPVISVAHSDNCSSDLAPPGEEDNVLSEFRGKRNSNSWMQQAKMLLTQESAAPDISSLMRNGLGLMEVTLIRAQDLESKDLNGFSDPYCEFKIGGECKYKSSVRKKTLNPCWDESAIMGLPRPGEMLEVVLWDHDTFGLNDFLGSVSLGIDDIRRTSMADEALFFPLEGVKSGSVELRIKVISEDAESLSYQASTNSNTSSPKLQTRHTSHIDVPNVPPPAPPRTVSLSYSHKQQTTMSNGEPQESQNKLINGLKPSPPTVPRVTITDSIKLVDAPVDSVKVTDLRTGLTVNGRNDSPSPNDDMALLKKGSAEYSSFRVMKQRMKRGLRLRRFKSEASVISHLQAEDEKVSPLNVEPSGGGESDATELLHLDNVLPHAVSQPDICRRPSPRSRRPGDLKVPAPIRPDKYFGVEGKVIRAQGLHIAHIAQLYCRVRLQSATSPDKVARLSASGRTVAKTRLFPAVPNPHIDLNFQLDNPDSVPRHAALVFEVRGSGKELIGSRRVTLQDLLSAAPPDTNEVHTWLALNNGASLEVEIAHNRELKKNTRKIFRSWSVHRIGKI